MYLSFILIIMKRFVVLLSALIPMLSFSQRLHVNLFGGFSNYLGDLQEKSVTLEQSNRAFGAGLSYDLTRHLSIRGGFNYGMIGANDKSNTLAVLRLRNLSFQSVIKEGNLMAEYNFFDITKRKFTPYVFGGLAVYHFNPFTFDTLGNKIYLQPLGTEGQGLAAYRGRKYNLTQFAIPFGAGLKMRLTDNIVVSYELGLRKLFTDYLDDVSTSYADQTLLAAAKGTTAVQLAYRSGELKNASAVYPPEGTIRGNPKQKDWYYMHGLTLSIGLHTRSKGKSRYDCPVDVK